MRRSFTFFANITQDGTFALQLKDIRIPEDRYYTHFAKGSGPGGQAVNTGRNKAIVHLTGCVQDSPLRGISQEIWENFLVENSHRVTNQKELIFTSHQHRSLYENVNECLRKIQKLLRDASYVSPPKEPVVYNPKTREKKKFKAWLYGSKNKQRIMRTLQ
ncbi:peptidyl-tRNA hydrolase ICT1 [Perkinsela sp. CCAP 1560/4]|nr:peptidyl-tRNA hydrolase ICT1 [Perkinsela sp. CCAP 1560/4]|eukprot:KNH08433.1 peptidyl-tRNA hydrolase ICT1 [Perkinsela sp. CCAP 1560/4]